MIHACTKSSNFVYILSYQMISNQWNEFIFNAIHNMVTWFVFRDGSWCCIWRSRFSSSKLTCERISYLLFIGGDNFNFRFIVGLLSRVFQYNTSYMIKDKNVISFKLQCKLFDLIPAISKTPDHSIAPAKPIAVVSLNSKIILRNWQLSPLCISAHNLKLFYFVEW